MIKHLESILNSLSIVQDSNLSFSIGRKDTNFNSPDELKYCSAVNTSPQYVYYVELDHNREYFCFEEEIECCVEDLIKELR